MKVRLVNASELKNEMRVAGFMASVSYDSKGDQMKIAEHCAKSGHGTPFRASRFIFEVSEVSRVLSHELVRHEIGLAKVQRSQRYVNEDGFKYTTPNSLNGVKVYVDELRTEITFEDLQSIVEQFYNGAVAQGVRNEDARYALTNATHTKLHLSFDLEALEQFCYRRCCTRAQWEIRELANAIKQLVVQELPVLEPLLGAPCHVHGYCPEANGCGIAPSKEEFIALYKVGKAENEKLLKAKEME